MLDGKMFLAATGTPILRITLANRPLALADPEPFTLANLTTKSFVAVSGFDIDGVGPSWAPGEALGSALLPASQRQKKPAVTVAKRGLRSICRARSRRRGAGARLLTAQHQG